MQTGIELIAAERDRQISKEGWTSKHDDQHTSGELALVGAAFALSTYTFKDFHSSVVAEVGAYFGDDDWFKTGDPVRNLVKAGAVIAAEIDRLNRYYSSVTPHGPEPDDLRRRPSNWKQCQVCGGIHAVREVCPDVVTTSTKVKCNNDAGKTPCCARAGEYNGFGSDGPLLFHCDIPNGCMCHD